jgi:hypothetical protein
MFTITERWLRENTSCGAITNDQATALGIESPATFGWIYRVIGKEITDEQRVRFEKRLKAKEARRLASKTLF